MLQVNRAYNKNDVILMRSKINIILKLYLHSDVLPRLRVRGTPTHFARKHFPHKNPEG